MATAATEFYPLSLHDALPISSEAAKRQHQRPPAKAFANMKTIDAVERHQPHVGRIAPYLQRAAAHARQGIAHHTVGVFWAACHVAKHAERREQKHGENASKPFEQTLH